MQLNRQKLSSNKKNMSREHQMIISDLNYLEFISKASKIVGGETTNAIAKTTAAVEANKPSDLSLKTTAETNISNVQNDVKVLDMVGQLLQGQGINLL